MPGWVPFDADSWPAVAAVLPKPWPHAAAAFDLRWWADRRPEVPSRRALIDRWGWTERQVRSLLRDESAWQDPKKRAAPELPQERPKVAPTVPQKRPNRVKANADNGEVLPQDCPKVAPELPQDCPKDVHTRVDHTTHTHSHPPTQDSPLPLWARKAVVPPGTDRALLVQVVMDVRNEVLGTIGSPDSSGTASKAVLALWKAVGHPDLGAFGRDLKLVAEAARDCPDRVFARDIRAEGWPDGTDRHRDITTVCRQDRWDLRLTTARAWDQAGRPTSSAPSASPPANESLGAKMRRIGMLPARREEDIVDAEFSVEEPWT